MLDNQTENDYDEKIENIPLKRVTNNQLIKVVDTMDQSSIKKE